MKRINTSFLLLLVILCNQIFIEAKAVKHCSNDCSISKNTWLPRSFCSYQMHEIIAQKKRIDVQKKKPKNRSCLSESVQPIVIKTQPIQSKPVQPVTPQWSPWNYIKSWWQKLKPQARLSTQATIVNSDNNPEQFLCVKKCPEQSPVCQEHEKQLVCIRQKGETLTLNRVIEKDVNKLGDITTDTSEKYRSIYISFFTEYMQNFGQKCGHHCKNLGSMPFWSGTNIMTVGNNDGRADLDAYQLGMGNIKVNEDGIGGVIQLNPLVQHVGSDMYLHWVHKQNKPGLYFKLHVPVGAMIIQPKFKELVQAVPDDTISFTQVTADPNSTTITYQFPEYPTPFFRPQTVSQAFFGGTPSHNRLDGNRLHPIRLRKARIAVENQVEIRLGDITGSLGYNIVDKPTGYFGVAFKFSCPTGNVALGDYMLEPIFGRAGLWGVGGDVSGMCNLWSNKAQTKSVNMTVQGEVLHLINGRTPNFRSFDLKQNGPGSKYLIVQKYIGTYDHRTSGFITTQGIEPRTIQPAANITTLPVISNIGVEGSLGFMLDYTSDNFKAGIGAEFWGRSAEKLQIDTRSAVAFRLPTLNDFAVLGRQLSGYIIDGQVNLLPTFYCQPLARIDKSQDAVQLVGTPPSVSRPTSLPAGIEDARIASNRIPAKFDEALDIERAQASAVWTGKIFGQAEYIWTKRYYSPSLSVVGSVEFSNNTNNSMQFWTVGLCGALHF